MLHDPLQLQTIMENSHLLVGSELDYAPLLDLVGDGRLVLIGTTSHGTHEFYRTRAYIAKPLIPEEGFIVVAAEQAAPDAHRLNGYVPGPGQKPERSSRA